MSIFFNLSGIWGRCSSSDKKLIQRLQTRCLKYIFKLPPRTPSKAVYLRAKVLPFEVMIEVTLLSLFIRLYFPIMLETSSFLRMYTTPELSLNLWAILQLMASTAIFSSAIDSYNSLPASVQETQDPKACWLWTFSSQGFIVPRLFVGYIYVICV